MKKSFSYAPKPFRDMSKGFKKKAIVHAILVVDRDKDGKRVSNKEFMKRVEETQEFFLNMFGGYTNEQINHGRFKSEKTSKIMKEKVAKIVGFADVNNFNKNSNLLQKWLLEKKKEWRQETIAYEFEGDIYFL